MFSSTAPPGASVAWPPRDERQGSTRGRPALGKTSLTKTTEIGTAIRPLRSVTLPARADGSPSAPRLGVRPRVPAPPDPAPSAHPGFSATNLRRGGAGQTARALPRRARPSAPDVRRRACWVGADAGRAMRATGATSRGGSRWSTGGASHRRRRAPHRWRRNHQRDQRHATATTGTRGAPVSADRLWPAVSGHANESRRFTRDNWNYRAQKSV